MLTWMAQNSVKNIDTKYMMVATIRPFSIIFFRCVHGPDRNMVLRIHGPHQAQSPVQQRVTA